VVNNECVACGTGTTNDSGDDASKSDTACDPALCSANEHVVNNECVACGTGTTNDSGDDASKWDTACDPVLCNANQHVVANQCVACPQSNVNAAGDNASGPDTSCGCTPTQVQNSKKSGDGAISGNLGDIVGAACNDNFEGSCSVATPGPGVHQWYYFSENPSGGSHDTLIAVRAQIRACSGVWGPLGLVSSHPWATQSLSYSGPHFDDPTGISDAERVRYFRVDPSATNRGCLIREAEPGDGVGVTIHDLNAHCTALDGINEDLTGTYVDGNSAAIQTCGSDASFSGGTCTKIPPTAPTAPTLRIAPSGATSEDDLQCVIETESVDPNGDEVSYTFTWRVDGVDAGLSDAVVAAARTATNEVWTCTATPSDGTLQGPPAEVSVTVADPLCGMQVVGYYPHYGRWRMPVADIQYQHLTDILYAGLLVEADGATTVEHPATLELLVETAHLNGVRVGLMVAGNFPEMTDNADGSRTRFLSELKEMVSLYKLDGVDFDWEQPGGMSSIQQTHYADLVAAAAAEFTPLQKFVTVATTDFRHELPGSALTHLTWMNCMSYDDGPPEHSSLQDGVELLNYWTNLGASPELLLMGTAFYALKADRTATSWAELVATYAPAPGLDAVDGWGFPGIDTTVEKVKHVMDGGYGGIMIWELSQDTLDSTSLLGAIGKTIRDHCSPE
jgi:hypothetical protein